MNTLKKFTEFIEEHLAGPMAKLANQRHLRAIRDGIIATLPLIIIGSFFLIIAFPPLPADWGVTQFLTSNAAVKCSDDFIAVSHDNVHHDTLRNVWYWGKFI